MKSHALLSPSSASRWLACTPSARLEAELPDKAGTAADEGTLAHRLGEAIIKRKLKMLSEAAYSIELMKIQAHELYENPMLEYCEDYAVYVLEQFAAAQANDPNAKIFIEEELDLSKYVPEGFGTGDIIIVWTGNLLFIDLKYGKGVEVSSVENKQLMLYALGALEEHGWLFDVDKLTMTIYQPRIDNISSWDIAEDELLKWAEDELKPKAQIAFSGQGEFVAGKHCQFCRLKPNCRAHAEMQLELANYDFKAEVYLKDDEISDILRRAKSFESWLKEVKDYALSKAVLEGKKWPGFKVVEGRSDRVYLDPDLVEFKLLKEGYSKESIYKAPELLGITAMEKELGKKNFERLLKNITIKPRGKPALAPIEDKRSEFDNLSRAAEDFKEEYMETDD